MKLTHPTLPDQPIDVPESTGETLIAVAGWWRADFDPGAHTVDQVLAHQHADDEETERVLDEERSGQARIGIVGHAGDEL